MIQFLLAAPRSGSGKTTMTCALLMALKRRGCAPCAFKNGPDYIDPMFHRAVLGVESRNLDLFFSAPETVRTLYAKGAAGHGAAVCEGAMGFYDGLGGVSDRASAWHLADTLGLPVLLVVEPKGQSLTLAAELNGLVNFRTPSHIAGILLNAYLPSTAPKMMEQLGLDASAIDVEKAAYGAQESYTVHKGEALFPRIDVAKEIAHLKEEDEKRKAAAEAAKKAKEEAEKKAAAPAEESNVDFTHEAEISYDDFCKVELRVAEVRACENLKESKKLLHLTVFDGERERCILSGIAKWFKPEDLIGKKLGIVCNLAPRPMMKGKYVSEGMIFAADTADGGCSIPFYSDDTPVGARIH